MDGPKYYITKEKLKEIEQKYQELKQQRRAQLEKESPPAFHSEELNTEFVSFQEGLDLLDSKIQEMEQVLKNFELIKQPCKKERDKVDLGASIQIKINGKTEEFRLVGTLEADPSNNRISNESPIGRALLGKKAGETAVVETPDKKHSYKIIKIKY